MKNLILIVSVFLTLQSCNKKELSLTEPGGEEVKLTLSAAQQPGAVGDTVTGEAASITQMTFIVFSAETGAEVQRITQSSSDPEFGDFSITLKKAEYCSSLTYRAPLVYMLGQHL